MLRRRGRAVASTARSASPALALFLCLFAGQAGVIAVSPVLAEVAADFGVSTATAGQLRSVSGLAAGLVALALGPLTGRFGLRELLLIGLSLLAGGSLLSAVAPSFAVLVAAQVAVGAGLATVLAGGLSAAAQWSAPDRRAQVLSWTLIGQPAAWIAGMPAIGLIGDIDWRWAWVAVPFAASLVALAAVASRPRDHAREQGAGAWRMLRRHPDVAGWALGEFFAYSAWAGTLVFAGALIVESYHASPGTAGILLGAAAVAYLPGNFIGRRWVDASSRRLLATLPLAAAGVVALLGAYRPAIAVSAGALTALAFLNGGRTIAGSALGLDLCAHRRTFAMRIRAAANQFGYLFGAALGGLALSAGGYAAMGATFAAMFALAAVPHLVALAGGEWRAPRLRRGEAGAGR